MEILLQGYSTYGIEGWNGTVEVKGLTLVQSKRLAGSANIGSLFRKLNKIITGPLSPVTFPEDFNKNNLDMGDFMQLLVALSAISGGSEFQRTYTCPKEDCKSANPRVIQLIKVFNPIKPQITGGTYELEIGKNGSNGSAPKNGSRSPKTEDVDKDSANPKTKIKCRNVTIGHFLRSYNAMEKLTLQNDKVRYGRFSDFEDEEDLEDFKEAILDIGTTALSVSVPNKDTVNDTVDWLLGLQGNDELRTYDDIANTISRLSPEMGSEYKTKCRECGTEIVDKLSPTEYFLGLG